MRVKKQGWINIYQTPGKDDAFVEEGRIWDSKDKAERDIMRGEYGIISSCYTDTIQIEWEEEV